MLISDLAKILRVRAKEAPLFMLERLLRESAREFFRASRIWRQDFSGGISAGSDTYSFTQPVGSLVYDILYAKLEQANVNLEYLRDAGNAYIRPDVATNGANTSYITLINNDMFRLFPAPAIADTINMRIVLVPTRNATDILDTFVEDFEKVLLDGALYRLYEMVGETWSSPRDAQTFQVRAMQGIVSAKLRGDEVRTPGVRVASFGW